MTQKLEAKRKKKKAREENESEKEEEKEGRRWRRRRRRSRERIAFRMREQGKKVGKRGRYGIQTERNKDFFNQKALLAVSENMLASKGRR